MESTILSVVQKKPLKYKTLSYPKYMNMSLLHCHISLATSVLEYGHISFRISVRLLDVR